jgi:chromosome segregation ATPase
MEIPSSKTRKVERKKTCFSPPVVAEKVKSRRPFTRSTTKQHVPIKDGTTETSSQQKDKFHISKNPMEVIDINTPPHESNPTFKRLRRQLKDAKTEIDKLKKEDLDSRIKLKEMLDIYEETIDKARFMAKRYFPLHRKLKNVYRQKRACQAEIRKLKAELQPFREEVEKRNLDMLAKVATRRSTRTKI